MKAKSKYKIAFKTYFYSGSRWVEEKDNWRDRGGLFIALENDI